ncbi:MAG: hypothetical protein GY950_08125, partial [bacterium]|nr:hypothetical protein [bacterium]
AEEAERRVQQIKSGEVKPIPGEEVFKEIRETIETGARLLEEQA